MSAGRRRRARRSSGEVEAAMVISWCAETMADPEFK